MFDGGIPWEKVTLPGRPDLTGAFVGMARQGVRR